MYKPGDYLPAAPLHELIRARRPVCREYTDTPAVEPCLRCLARDVSMRYGATPDATHRQLCRILHRSTIAYCVADRLTIALGSHPALLWREWTRVPA